MRGMLPVAVGRALAFRVRGEPRVACAFLGDGAAQIGAAHEAVNLASPWRLPVIFLIEHDGFPPTVPNAAQAAVPERAMGSAGYGMPGVRVDGNDVRAVFGAVAEAATRPPGRGTQPDRGPHPTARGLLDERSRWLSGSGRDRRLAVPRPDPAAARRTFARARRERAPRARGRGRAGTPSRARRTVGAGRGARGRRTRRRAWPSAGACPCASCATPKTCAKPSSNRRGATPRSWCSARTSAFMAASSK